MSSKVSCDGTSVGAGGCGGAGSSGGGGGGGGSNGPCGACKFLRRKCVPGCIFAPYFDQDQGAAYFAAVHKVFGASNVSKLLLHIPVHKRLDAVVTICYEAQSRLRDPVYGCVSHIFALQQQVMNLQSDLSYLQGHLDGLQIPTPPPPPPPPVQPLVMPPVLSISDLPTSAIVPPTYDLSSLFDPVGQTQWMLQLPHQQTDPCQYGGGATRAPPEMSPSGSGAGGGDDLQELARELLQQHANPTVPCTRAPPLPPDSK
ncbi:lob domain-containing 18 [Olea europaea subsp. europaea]|uniref:Lob domain-containing 18 n=1 Tax=Olea europaea subsp. europaea TaxID=158383 RepID=A0A8S0RYV1_OLEEU|nr:lob domain-containing 18 [Olea europaea subsp. europaea]